MKRRHLRDDAIRFCEEVRQSRPDMVFGADIIAGFPTETEEEFQETMRLLERVQYDNIYAFAYSPRPGTRAAKLPDDVPADVKRDRLNRLLAHQMKIAEARYASRIGKVMTILVDGLARNQNILRSAGHLGDANDAGREVPREGSVLPGLRTAADAGRVWTGRTECNRVVNFVSDDGRNLVGRIVPVEITDSTALSLVGKLFHDSDFAERASS
jgi:tRNA A37 methylthiotransferase MiaB